MEMPLAIDDVRLVVPQVFTETHGDRTYKVHQDVIVEAVDVERHTSGADPFTGEDTAQVPKEHQVDPFTGKPILHRYIAGTRIPIPWPWETEQQNKDDSEVIDQDKLDEEDKARGIRGILRKPLAWWGRGAKKPEQSSSKASSERKDAADYDPEIINRGEPSEREPRDFDDDTTRNLVEMREIAPNLYDDPNAFHPSLVYPPIPETIIEEIQGHSKFRRTAELSAEEKEAYRARRRAEREAKARRQEEKKQKATATMKTPMQVRWELQQAKKQNAPPTIPSEDLLLAIGKHMAAKGRTLEKEAA
jgi:large subunit ribosomal protein L24